MRSGDWKGRLRRHPVRPRAQTALPRHGASLGEPRQPRLRLEGHSRGVCDGCALGTARPATTGRIDGVHLCMVRLNLLRLEHDGRARRRRALADVAALRASCELARAARARPPAGAAAAAHAASAASRASPGTSVRATSAPHARRRSTRAARRCIVTSRGVTNEVYYVAQKVMRRARQQQRRQLRAPLPRAEHRWRSRPRSAHAATTCSYRDWYGSRPDRLLRQQSGQRPAGRDEVPRTTRGGAARASSLVNPLRRAGDASATGCRRPSSSALFGTKIERPHLRSCKVGGDLAFLTAVAKVLVERGWHAPEFIAAATTGFDELRRAARRSSRSRSLAAAAGVTAADVRGVRARRRATRSAPCCVWSHGHHAPRRRRRRREGDREPRPAARVRRAAGLRTDADPRPLGRAGRRRDGRLLDRAAGRRRRSTADRRARFSELWGFDGPDAAGPHHGRVLVEAAGRGELDGLYCIGGNFLETLPEPERVADALAKIPLRIHTDLVSHEPDARRAGGHGLLSCRRARATSSAAAATETSTERRIVSQPEIPGPRHRRSARPSGGCCSTSRRARRSAAWPGSRASRDAAARSAPRSRASCRSIDGVEHARAQRRSGAVGGPRPLRARLAPPLPPTASGRARAAAVPLRGPSTAADARFRVSTRRGKQFNSYGYGDDRPADGRRARRGPRCSAEDATRARRRRRDSACGAALDAAGASSARVQLRRSARGNLQVHWPEAEPG